MIAIEPGYALAYAMIAGAYSYLGATGQELPRKAFEIVYRYAQKALKLDSSIAEGHTAIAGAYLFYERNWKKAYEALQTALHLNPGYVEVYELLSFYYVLMGKNDQAVKIMEKAEELDPL
ncbi:MAG: tetratricopeptide repeat protein [Ferruginibacter sp.]